MDEEGKAYNIVCASRTAFGFQKDICSWLGLAFMTVLATNTMLISLVQTRHSCRNTGINNSGKGTRELVSRSLGRQRKRQLGTPASRPTDPFNYEDKRQKGKALVCVPSPGLYSEAVEAGETP